jgi:hypothetical protein
MNQSYMGWALEARYLPDEDELFLVRRCKDVAQDLVMDVRLAGTFEALRNSWTWTPQQQHNTRGADRYAT